VSADLPPLGRAVSGVPRDFLATFASVRPHCRTLEDFMVANELPIGHEIDGAGFERLREEAGSSRLATQAATGEVLRAHWRITEFDAWVALHTMYPGIADLVRATAQPVAVVSAKDATSIWAILDHSGLGMQVHTVVGSCTDKRPALTGLAELSGEPVTFVDDNLGHVLVADTLPDVTAWWATWGYHSREDEEAAAGRGVRAITLDQLDVLARRPVRGARAS
jgi:phosphoglycolate phosphatase-like HAD superfamily hydrolase